MELKFRDLKADEIELRVGSTKRKYPSRPKGEDNPTLGFQILLYKNARVDANILDETVGPFNWTKEYYQVKNTMFCRVGIRNDNGEWVYKSDAGDDDFQTEQVKGEASDSFKRASFAWGIGRKNLYYGPFIWIKCTDEINEFSKLYVSEIEYKDSIISKLVIRERNTDREVYSFNARKNVSQSAQNSGKTSNGSGKGTIRPSEKEKINKYVATLDATQADLFFKWLEKHFGTMSIDLLSDEQGLIICANRKLI